MSAATVLSVEPRPAPLTARALRTWTGFSGNTYDAHVCDLSQAVVLGEPGALLIAVKRQTSGTGVGIAKTLDVCEAPRSGRGAEQWVATMRNRGGVELHVLRIEGGPAALARAKDDLDPNHSAGA